MRTQNWHSENWKANPTVEERECSDTFYSVLFPHICAETCFINKCLIAIFVMCILCMFVCVCVCSFSLSTLCVCVCACVCVWLPLSPPPPLSFCHFWVCIWTFLKVYTWKERRCTYDQMHICKNWKRCAYELLHYKDGKVGQKEQEYQMLRWLTFMCKTWKKKSCLLNTHQSHKAYCVWSFWCM